MTDHTVLTPKSPGSAAPPQSPGSQRIQRSAVHVYQAVFQPFGLLDAVTAALQIDLPQPQAAHFAGAQPQRPAMTPLRSPALLFVGDKFPHVLAQPTW